MQLNRQLAEQIAGKTQAILDRRVLVTDKSGQVLAGHDGAPAIIAEALNSALTGRQIIADFEGLSLEWLPFVYEGQTLGVFGLSLATGPLTPEAIALTHSLAEVITHQYFLVEQLQSLDTMRGDFIREALTAPHVDLEDLGRRADILQLDLQSPQAVLVFRVEEPDGESRQAFAEALGESPNHLSTHLDESTFLVVHKIDHANPTTQNTARFMTETSQKLHKALHKKLQKAITGGVGQYYPNLSGLRKSYQDARLALEVGSRVWVTGTMHHIKQVGTFITLTNASQARKAELAHQILSPLLRDEQLFKTVRTFLTADLSLTNAAEQLHIHRNTLIYRLDKTKKLIGLDPRHFDDALQIKLGLMFYQPAEV